MDHHIYGSSVKHADDRIVIEPDVCNGQPVIRGLRITVETVLDHLGAGDTPDEILAEYPDLVRDDIAACLAYASLMLRHRFSILKTG